MISRMPTESATPVQHAHYDIVSKLGYGAMGVVYLARDRRIGRHVALKIVRPQRFDSVNEAKEFFDRLQREAELSGLLHHRNIATLYEVGYERNLISYLAMEYVEGKTVHALLREFDRVPLDQALDIVDGVLQGLQYAHERGIIHRDIKPANIILTPDGVAKILDFGIARREDSTLTVSGSFVGTPNYMAPEQIKSAPITPRTDLFSVGIVLHEMLTGAKPFDGDSFTTIMFNVVEKEPASLCALDASVPQWVDRFLSKLLAKDPSQRFDSATTALEELRRIRAAANGQAPISILEPPSFEFPPSESRVESDDQGPPTLPDITLTAQQKHLRPLLAWAILLAITIPLLFWIGWANWSTTRPTTSAHSPQELSLFAAKKKALTDARALLDGGKLDEAEKAYQDYLSRYPASQAAQEALSEIATRRAATVTIVETKPVASTTTAAPVEEKKSSRFSGFKSRLKKIFGRGK